MSNYITKTFTFEGKRYYVRGKTEREALLKLANKQRDLEEGKVAVSGYMTVSSWAYKAVETYKTNQKDITREKYIQRMKKCILDEIGDMPMDLQVKLLRAIQNKEITRVGGTRIIKLDIRFIAATNSDLRKKIAEGTFRQDLFYRLNVIPIHMPALRCRKDDIRVVCDHFIDMYNKKHGRHLSLTENQYRFIENYQWPGNIRELENVIEYLVICASGTNPELNDYMLRGILEQDAGSNAELNMAMAMSHINSPAAPPVLSSEGSLSDALEDYEISLIESVLAESRSLREAGAKLGINASTLSRKIKQYGINYEKSR